MNEKADFLGRLLTQKQVPKEFLAEVKTIPAIVKSKQGWTCARCGTLAQPEWLLPNASYYCRECLLLGRVRSDEPLYYFPQQPFSKESALTWQGQLTPYQEQVSQGLLQAWENRQPTLVHAVTGAGKTEMIYQVVARVIEQGGAVCLASPRIDVCLELAKRLKNDFSCPIALLHGDSEPYQRSPLVVATTHQLLKFYRAFDLLIVDEVDAFPYVDNAMLYHAVEQSVKETGVRFFLTATSTDELDKKVARGDLQRLSLPRRFHGNALVVPKKIWLSGVDKLLLKGKIPTKLITYIRRQRKTGFPLLIFASEIAKGEQLAQVLMSYFPEEKIGFVSSKTENRLELVQAFREQELTILVSTTILERGITFPCVDVFVVEAHHRLFSKSALVQIGGRVGRSMERPTGDLFFFHEGTTLAIEKAIAEIKMMNAEAGLG
ncbi:DEAD/DEAH box helicase [Streptococcus massiliensis]|uniref:Putative ATP-dependent RNA helicase n=1 Tax=Streptococcus massiliensis TaxID=313439 RepID=A0A380L278_9STRE|nr:DEAD/DEAH box helicase [Streptococcus massiliensis]SUN77455.1 putative ATP-dependent RNA helicase [Streptococcus massiliensis]